MYSLKNPWFRRTVTAMALLTLACVLVGFVVLPWRSGGFTAQGIWSSICGAAGVPGESSKFPATRSLPAQATHVILERSMARASENGAVGRGATLGLNCTMCHGAQGTSTSDAPNLAGQYPEVLIKQLIDFRSGKRASPTMQALAQSLSDRDVRELAAFFSYLPKARTAPTTYDESLPPLVRVGAPLRNIAPCISCHGGVDQKLGAPWIEGMPKQYLVAQLKAFRDGGRGNDAEAQMRNVARAMRDDEIDSVSTFYAGKMGTTSE